MRLGRCGSSAWLVSLTGVAAVSAGCGALLGIEDFSPAQGDGGAVRDGDGSAGDSSGEPAGCGPSCAGTCSGGECVVTLATGQTETLFVAVNSKGVYWENDTPVPVVMTVPLDGGTPSTVTSLGDLCPFAVDETSLYFAVNGGPGGGLVLKMPLEGGSAVTLASGLTNPWSIVVGANDVYWTECDDAGSVMAAPTSGGGTPTTLLTGLMLPCDQPLQYGMAVNATTLFWRTNDANIVASLPLDGGAPGQIHFGNMAQNWPVMMAADDTAIYYTNAGGSTTGLPGNVLKESLEGGAPVTLATGQTSPYGIAVEGRSVYWGDVGGGNAGAASIMSLTPK